MFYYYLKFYLLNEYLAEFEVKILLLIECYENMSQRE